MALTGILSKAALKDLPPVLVFMMQSVIVGVMALGIGLFGGAIGGIAKVGTRELGYIIGACVTVCLASMCNFGALSMANASKVQPLAQLSLVFGLGLAFIFLKEEINARVIFGSALIFVGALIVATGSSK